VDGDGDGEVEIPFLSERSRPLKRVFKPIGEQCRP
jgi:hypothetical protein